VTRKSNRDRQCQATIWDEWLTQPAIRSPDEHPRSKLIITN
jgi:hypothetical protein